MKARRASLCAGAAACALVAGIAASAPAQERAAGSGEATSPPAIGAGARPHEGAQWDLPRVFYDSKQRRVLDAADRALRLGLRPPGEAAGGARFDGWVAGPTATHAWVNGSSYVAGRDGRLQPAPAGTIDGVPMPSTSDDGASRNDRLDTARGELVVIDAEQTPLRLRVGEAEGRPRTPQIGAPGAAPVPGGAAPR